MMDDSVTIALTAPPPDKALSIGAERDPDNIVRLTVTNRSGGALLVLVEVRCEVGQTGEALLATVNEGVDARLLQAGSGDEGKRLERTGTTSGPEGLIWSTSSEGTPLPADGTIEIILGGGALEAPVADILEPVRNIGRRNHDVADEGAGRGDAHGECGLSLPDDPGLGIGMHVQGRSLAWLVIDQEQRDGAAVVAAFETDCAALAGFRFPVAENLQHRRASSLWAELSSREDISHQNIFLSR